MLRKRIQEHLVGCNTYKRLGYHVFRCLLAVAVRSAIVYRLVGHTCPEHNHSQVGHSVSPECAVAKEMPSAEPRQILEAMVLRCQEDGAFKAAAVITDSAVLDHLRGQVK